MIDKTNYISWEQIKCVHKDVNNNIELLNNMSLGSTIGMLHFFRTIYMYYCDHLERLKDTVVV